MFRYPKRATRFRRPPPGIVPVAGMGPRLQSRPEVRFGPRNKPACGCALPVRPENRVAYLRRPAYEVTVWTGEGGDLVRNIGLPDYPVMPDHEQSVPMPKKG